MGKLSIDDLSAVLIEKHGLMKKEAQSFVAAIFEMIRFGVDKEQLVKVKGLGTFKVIGVDARESVNVNTGERVLIDSHSKISFTPDAMMKELVNKPFSSFETVVLNEGVEFDDMLVNTESEALDTEEKAKQLEEPVAEESAPAVEDSVPAVEEPAPAVEVSSSVVEETNHPLVEFAESEAESETAQNEETMKENITNKHETPRLLVLISLLAGFGLGYMVRDFKEPTTAAVQEQVQAVSAEEKEAVKTDTLETQAVAAPVVEGAAPSDSVKKEEPKPAIKEETKPDAQPDYMKYEAMDSRVRLGAYYIIGTAQVVKAREGETLDRISRSILGKDMVCYVEVYNGIKASTPLKAGQDIKIPKLITKKAMRERQARENRKRKNINE